VRKNNFSNGAGAITDRTPEKQAFLIIPEGVAEVIFAHRLSVVGTPWNAGGLLEPGAAEDPARRGALRGIIGCLGGPVR